MYPAILTKQQARSIINLVTCRTRQVIIIITCRVLHVTKFIIVTNYYCDQVALR